MTWLHVWICSRHILSESFLLDLSLGCLWEGVNQTFLCAKVLPSQVEPLECGRYWPPHCESHTLRLKCQPSPLELDNNHNEDVVTTAVKCSSTDGVCWNLPFAVVGGGGLDKRCIQGLLLMIRPLDKNHQPPYLMEIALDEMLGHMWAGSARGHLLTSQKKNTSHQGIPAITLH